MNHHQEVSEVDGAVAVFIKLAESFALELRSLRGAQHFLTQLCELLRRQLAIGTFLLEVRVEVLESGDVLASGVRHLFLNVAVAPRVTLFVSHGEMEMTGVAGGSRPTPRNWVGQTGWKQPGLAVSDGQWKHKIIYVRIILFHYFMSIYDVESVD